MHAHHGNTPAAWTGVIIILAGFVVGGMGLILHHVWVFWIGVGLVPFAVIVGLIMRKMGLGIDPVGR